MTSTKITCQRELCGKDFDVIMPEPEFINTLKSSMVVFPHGELFACPYCGQAHSFILMTLQNYTYAFNPVETKAKSQIIKPLTH